MGSFVVGRKYCDEVRNSLAALPVPHTPRLGHPMAIRGNQRQSEAIRAHQRPSEAALPVPHTPSDGNQRQSEAHADAPGRHVGVLEAIRGVIEIDSPDLQAISRSASHLPICMQSPDLDIRMHSHAPMSASLSATPDFSMCGLAHSMMYLDSSALRKFSTSTTRGLRETVTTRVSTPGAVRL